MTAVNHSLLAISPPAGGLVIRSWLNLAFTKRIFKELMDATF